ncbi:hypothetical protein SKDZ_14G1360 [Saccharomyces kudriavzevii ZP591]|nr:hypothetical protein SKDZ_14G1360 [Saccharomyces kudriavzevii ZP591]
MNVTSPKDEIHRFSKKKGFNTGRARFQKLSGRPQDINVPEDRDSIVSSNTTTIMTDDASDYNGGRRSHGKSTDSDSDGENNITIKKNNSNHRNTGINPFYSESAISRRYTQFKQKEIEPTFADNESVRYSSDEDKVKSDEVDNIENELQFTPRIKEPGMLRSILLKQRTAPSARSSILKEPQVNFKPTTNNKRPSQRKSSAALRKQLGKPLPLPYLNDTNGSTIFALDRKEGVFTDEVVQKKKELIESKWHRLLLHDKKMVEEKLEGLREYERRRMPSQGSGISSLQQDNSFKISTPTKSYVSLEGTSLPCIPGIKTPINVLGDKGKKEAKNDVLQFQWQRDPLQKLQSEIEMHTEKLDKILKLLKDDAKSVGEIEMGSDRNVALGQGNDERWWKSVMMNFRESGNIIKAYKEYFLWTICILILLYCNIYVYYKL